MISDTLSQAVAEMRRYVSEFPRTYADNPDLLDLIDRMEAMRMKLDTPPPVPMPLTTEAVLTSIVQRHPDSSDEKILEWMRAVGASAQRIDEAKALLPRLRAQPETRRLA